MFSWVLLEDTYHSLKLLGVVSSVYASPSKWQNLQYPIILQKPYNITSTTKTRLETKTSLLCQMKSISLFSSLPDDIQSTLKSEWSEQKWFLILINSRLVTWEIVISRPATFHRVSGVHRVSGESDWGIVNPSDKKIVQEL